MQQSQSPSPMKYLNYAIIGVVLCAVVFIGIAFGLSTKCPKCGKWFALKEQTRKEIRREDGTKMVPLNQVPENQKRKYRPKNKNDREVEVKVLRVTYDGSYKCSSCGHKLKKEFIEENIVW